MLPVPSSKFQFAVEREIQADSLTVFDALTSESGMKQWISGCQSVAWSHPEGRTTPGVGSLRRVVLFPKLLAPERILAWDEGRGLHYTFDGGSIPVGRLVRNYVGVTRLEAIQPGSTRLIWAVHFDPRSTIAGLVLRVGLKPVIGLMCRNIGRLAETKKAGSGI